MVSSIGSNYSTVSAYTTRARPDPAELASKLFSKLDTKGQGYIQKSDLESAFSQVYSSSSSATATNASSASEASSDASQLFSALDSDGNGQVTESEFSSGLQQLADALDSQAFSSRMQGAGGMPPPPPHGHGNGDGEGQNDTGFTKDQLSSQLQEIGSTDSKRASLISDVVKNFDKADADGDGKVTRQEAMAYEQSQSSASAVSSSTSDSTTSTTSSTSAAKNSDAVLMHRLMELMRTYGANSATSDGTGSASSITVSA